MTGCLHRSFFRKGYGLLALMSLLLTNGGCQWLAPGERITTRDGKTITANDATVKQYLAEWSESKESIERLADLESDLSYLLTEVSKLSDLGNTPGKTFVPGKTHVPTKPSMQSTVPSTQAQVATASTPAAPPITALPNQITPATPANAIAVTSTDFETGVSSSTINPLDMSMLSCPGVGIHSYKKSLLFMNFPRVSASSSQLGALHQVDHHLPLLVGANLYNRHQHAAPLQLRSALPRDASEFTKATHAKQLARQHRVQFVVSGDVDDMAMTNPRSVNQPSYYTRVVNGVHNLFNIKTRFDKRNRVFSFNLEVRDGFSGHVVFSQQYNTYGKWTHNANASIGFGSPEFWKSDYGVQVQHLVARASDDLAALLKCQSFFTRVDSSPSQQFVVIQSGANHGVKSGDTFDVFQLVNQDIPGQYQHYETRLIPQTGRVYITEIYPSHSVGQVINQTLLYGQYVVKGR